MIGKLLQLQRKAWSAAFRAAGLPVTCLVRRSDRHLVWRMHELCFGSGRVGVYPEVSLGRLLGPSTSVSVTEIPTETYNVTEYELVVLAAVVARVAARTAFEFGTADGRTTLNLAMNASESGHVYTLNIPVEMDVTHNHNVPVGARFIGRQEAGRITQLWGDSSHFDFSPYHGRCQMVFIDADHSESAVSSDSQNALRLIDRQRGMILWHDALRYGVQYALPRFGREQKLPIHVISGTNLALACFAGGQAVAPGDWAKEVSHERDEMVDGQVPRGTCNEGA